MRIPHVSLYKACSHLYSCLTVNDFQHIRGTVVDEEIHMELVFRSQHEDEFERKADRETQVCDSYLYGIVPSANRIHISRERQETKYGITDLVPPFPPRFLLG